MALTSTQALQLLNDNPGAYDTPEKLMALVKQLSLDPTAGRTHGSVTVLYSGGITQGGSSTNDIIRQMVSDGADVRVIDTTHAAEFMNHKEFKLAATRAFNETDPAKIDVRNTPLNDFFFHGEKGVWAETSHRFAAATIGEVRVLGGYANFERTFGKVELPALLNNANVTSIDGIDIAQLRRISGDRARFNAVKANAMMQMHFSDVSQLNYRDYLALTPEKTVELSADKTRLAAWETTMRGLNADNAADLANGTKAAAGTGATFAKLGMAKALNKLGLIGGVLSFMVASSAAAQAAEAGNDHEAKEIMKLWAVDTAGSELGAVVGTAIGTIVGGALVAAGVAVSAPLLGALALGGALIGSIFFADGAKELYDLMDDRDGTGKRDIVDRLEMLWYGQTYTLSDPPPADMWGIRQNMDASLTKEQILEAAKNDIAWRYAVRELNPFVILGPDYDKHNLDGSLDYYDELENPSGLTDEFLKDRIDMLWWKMQFDKKGARDDNDFFTPEGSKTYDEDWDSNTVQGNWDYVDHMRQLPGRQGPLTLAIDGQGLSVDDHQIIFGKNKPNEGDILEGEADDDRIYGLAGNDSISGENGNDYLEGNAGDDKLDGGAGRDKMVGGSGNDLLDGGLGADLLLGGSNNDTLNGGRQNDALYGGDGNDILSGDEDNDFVNGGAGNDTLMGGTGNDYLFDQGGLDTNTLQGDDGSDVLIIRAGKGMGLLDGGSGNDILIGGEGTNSLDGGSGNDLITGNAGYDIILGEDGADNIDAGAGSDVMTGGEGADYLRGGTGNDTYVYDTETYGTDLIDDSSGSDVLFMGEEAIGSASYDKEKRCWVSANGYEIRQLKRAGSTTLAVSAAGSVQHTVYVHNWTPGQFGIVLEGEEAGPERPDVQLQGANTRAENNFVDFFLTDAGDGGQGNDIVRGTDAASVLAGGTGNDILDGRGGDDWLEGGAGSDIILTGDGKDVAYGGAGDDIIRAGYRWDMNNGVYADSGAPSIFYSAGAGVVDWLQNSGYTDRPFTYTQEREDGSRYTVTLPANPQLAPLDFSFERKLEVNETYTGYMYWWNVGGTNVSMEPSLKINLTLGDAQEVWYDFATWEKRPTENFGKPKSFGLELGNAKEVLQAGSGQAGARLYGGEGDDVVYGANENDLLYGEAGADLLVGYDGNDELHGAEGKDELSGGDGRDFLDGGDDNDQLSGGSGADALYGGAGDDGLTGDAFYLKGTNWYPPGLDESKMAGDYLDGGVGNDTLWGNNGDDYLFGGTGNDQLYGGLDNDHQFGETGEDTLAGGKGGDYLDGGAEKDMLVGEEGDDILLGGAGDDQLDGAEDSDILEGGDGNDILTGGDGADILRGGAGGDVIYGDSGAGTNGEDIIEGGAGNDTLNGGGRSDTYVFATGDGQDTLQDDGTDGSRNVMVFQFSPSQLRAMRRDGLDLVVEYGSADLVRVQGFYAGHAHVSGYQGDGPEMTDQGEGQSLIAAIQFEDGTSWGIDKILEMAPPPEPGDIPADPFADLEPLYFINSLLSREEIRAAGKKELSFSFVSLFRADAANPMPFTDAQKDAVRAALARFSDVLDLRFVEIDDPLGDNANLVFQMDDLTSVEMGAFAGYASPATGKIHLNSTRYGMQYVDEFGNLKTRDSLAPGQGGFQTLLHEIAHALGLKHPFEAPLLPRNENNSANTVMSYTQVGEAATDLARFDIAALQYLYGVAKDRKTGDDTYTFQDRFIEDGGGVDTFDASAETNDVAIRLEGGRWVYSGEQADSILADGQAFIGFGTGIENAKGGFGNDVLVGNDGTNRLDGGAGSDTLVGGAGDDVLAGGEGVDTYMFERASGADTIVESGQDTRLVIDGVGGNELYYRDGAIYFGGGDERIEVDLDEVAELVIDGMSFRGAAVRALLESMLSDDGDLALAEGKIRGRLLGDGDWRISGNELANILNGNAGHNTLEGGTGDDTLLGGAGDDAVYGGEGADTLLAQAGNDLLEGGAGADTYVLEGGNALIRDGEGANVIRIADAGVDLSVADESTGASLSAGVVHFPYDESLANSPNAQVAQAAASLWGEYAELRSNGTHALVQGGLDANISEVVDSHGNRVDWAQLMQQARAWRDDSIHAELNRRWYGSDYDDWLHSSESGYTFVGGRGSDNITATGSGNTFLFAKGDGNDLIRVVEGNAAVAGNTLRFGPGIKASDIRLVDDGGLVIHFDNGGWDTVRIEGFKLDDLSGLPPIDRFQFVDGTMLGFAELLERGIDHHGDWQDNRIQGTALVDRMNGSWGSDTLAGGAGSDVYTYESGGGDDWIQEGTGAPGDVDVLRLVDIDPRRVRVWKGQTEMWLTIRNEDGSNGTILLQGQLRGQGRGIERVEFSDGTTWRVEDLAARAQFDVMDPVHVVGTDQADELAGLEGDDTVIGQFGDDLIEGGTGNDVLHGAYDYDAWWDGGGDGGWFASAIGGPIPGDGQEGFRDNDTIHGGAGDDIIDGGYRADEDTLHGEAGDDTYVFRRGGGADTIVESGDIGNADRVVFENLNRGDLRFDRTETDLRIRVVDSGDSLVIKDFFGREDGRVERFEFADDAPLELEELMLLLLDGTELDDQLFGYESDDNLYGAEGDDTLFGAAGDDILAGGIGRDSLDGGTGNDTYHYDAGDGDDVVNDSGAAGDIDRIVLGAGVLPEGVIVSRDDDGLVLYLRETGEQIALPGWFGPGVPSIEELVFEDGTVWTAEMLTGMAGIVPVATEGDDFIGGTMGDDLLAGLGGNDRLYGVGGNDTLDGGLGDDLVAGGAGDDTYVWRAGDGNDTIADKGALDHDVLVFADGVEPGDVRVTRDARSLLLVLASGEVLTVADWFEHEETRLGAVRFADGTVWSREALETLARTGTDSADYLVGSADADYVEGLAGDDTILAGAGDDTLAGGSGDDLLDGGSGNDSYLFEAGDGADRIDDAGGIDRLVFGAGIVADEIQVLMAGDGTLVLQRHGTGDRIAVPARFVRGDDEMPDRLVPLIEEVAFADGTVWSAEDVGSYAMKMPSSEYDDLDGTERGEIIDGLGGGDSVWGWYGSDRYIFKAGYGWLTIHEADWNGSSADVLEFGPGIDPAGIVVKRENSGLVLELGGGDRVTIASHFSSQGGRIEHFRFADGTDWSIQDVELRQLVDEGTDADNLIYGSARGDVIDGRAGADFLYGGAGDDTLTGGSGSEADIAAETTWDQYGSYYGNNRKDVLDGGSGDDTYLVNADSGYDLIQDEAGNDRVLLGAGLSVDDIIISDGSWYGHSGQLRVDYGKGAFYIAGASSIERIESLDGKFVTREEFADYRVSRIYGTGAAERIDGSRGPNEIYAEAGDDTVHGGAGRDTIEGGTGNDVLYGDGGADDLRGGEGNNQLHGGDGDDTLSGGGYLSGGEGNDVLYSNSGTAILDGGAGDDRLSAGAGGGILFGIGAGHDRMENSSGYWIALGAGVRPADVDIVGGEVDGVVSPVTLVIRASGDSLANIGGAAGVRFADGTVWDASALAARISPPASVGTGGADILLGDAGNNAIDGGAGNDTVAGGAGEDFLRGADGKDRLLGGDGADQLEGGGGNDTLEGGAGVDLLEGGAGHDELHGGAGDDTLAGGAGDDVLYGEGGVNTYRFGRGSGYDTIHDARGDAAPRAIIELEGLNPDDILFQAADSALLMTIRGTSDVLVLSGWRSQSNPVQELVVRFADGSEWGNADLLAATDTGAALRGDFRDNVILGRDDYNDEYLSGAAGNDLLDGGAGEDSLAGDEGDDTLLGGAARDYLSGGDGRDQLTGGDDRDTLYGGSGDDVLQAGAGDDWLVGDLGNDVIDGGAGDDRIETNDSYNQPNGGNSADTILFGLGSGHDTLYADNYDRIQLGEGLALQDIDIAVVGSDLVLTLKETGESLAISSWSYRAERLRVLRFADGSELDLAKRPSGPFIGSDANDSVGASQASPFDDDVFGLGGNDALFGGEGNDRLHGGAGNDTLYGGSGENLFDGGKGSDYYYLSGSSDTLLFGFDSGSDGFGSYYGGYAMPKAVRFENNVTRNDVVIQNLTLALNGSGSFQVGLKGSTATLGYFRVETDYQTGGLRLATDFVFGDGSVVKGADVLDVFYRNGGTAASDVIVGGAGGDNLDGQAGDDVLYAGAGADLLQGGQGSDRLNGGSGDDTLVGGAGNDQLDGGTGRDVIRVDLGSGIDTISPGYGESLDVVEFGSGIAAGDILVGTQANGWNTDLTLTVAGSGTKLVVSNGWLRGYGDSGSTALLGELRFADGTVWTGADIARRLITANGSANTVQGTSGADVLAGLGGNDTVYGAEGNDVLAGDEGDDLVYGGAGGDRLLGGTGDDLLDGGSGSDILDGGAGNDTLSGGAGSDRYSFGRGSGSDLISEFGGDPRDVDTLQFGPGIGMGDVTREIVDGKLVLTINGSADSVTIEGAGLPFAGIERIRFADGTVVDPLSWQVRDLAVTLGGGSGQQVVAAGMRYDTLVLDPSVTPGALAFVRDGQDLVASSGLDSVRFAGWFDDTVTQSVLQARFADGSIWTADEMSRQASRFIGGAGKDSLSAPSDFAASLSGMAGDDRLLGGNGEDLLEGGDGNDFLDGGIGADRMEGGAGDDFYVLDDAGDTVVELAGGGSDTVRMTALSDITVSGEIENVEALGSANINMFGNAENNRLAGTSGINRIEGGAGDDVLDGGAGADTLVGGLGNDTLVVDNAADTIVENAGEGIDTVAASISYVLASGSNLENITLLGEGNINATGDGGANVLVGNSGRNVIRGLGGDDVIDGGAGADVLHGGAGNDVFIVDDAADTVNELAGEGIDEVRASASFTLGANVENLVLTGGAAVNATGNALDNRLSGNLGNNTLSGGAGNDLLDGGAGNDLLVGGAGNDSYLFGGGAGQDIVDDAGTASSTADLVQFGAGINPADLILRWSGNDLVVSIRNTQDRLTLRNYRVASGAVETFRFDDGSNWDLARITAEANATPANTDPFLAAAPADMQADVGAPFSLSVANAFADADAGDMLVVSATLANGDPLPRWLSYDAATKTFSGLPREGDTGTISIRLVASDSGNRSVADVFDLSVRNPDDTSPVVAVPLEAQEARQDAAFAYTLAPGSFLDTDPGDQLSYTATLANGQPLPRWLSFDAVRQSFAGTPGKDDVGDLAIAVTARDTRGRSATSSFLLTIDDINDPPRVAKIVEDQIVAQGQSIDLLLAADMFVDREGDPVSVTLTLANGDPLPDWLSFDAATRRLTGTSGADDVGITAIRVIGTDSHGLSASDEFEIVVADVNDGPNVANPIATQVAREGQPFRFKIPANLFADPDRGDTLSYSVQLLDGPAHRKQSLSFDAYTNTISLVNQGGGFTYSNLDFWDVGTWSFRITAKDALGAQASTDFKVEVEKAAINHMPVITTEGQPWNAVGYSYDGTGMVVWTGASRPEVVASMASRFKVAIPTFTDIDGDALSYQVRASGDGIDAAQWTYDAATKEMRYTGSGAAPRRVTLDVIATDTHGASSMVKRQVIANHAPTIGEIPEIVVRENQAFAIQLPREALRDADGDAIRVSSDPVYSWNPLTYSYDYWGTLNGDTLVFSGEAGDFAVGTHYLTVYAADAFAEFRQEPDAKFGGWTGLPSKQIKVTVLNDYDAPVLANPLQDQTVREDDNVWINTAGAFRELDPDQELTYTATLANGEALPAWMIFDSTYGTLQGKPLTDNVGNYSIKVTATDLVGGAVSDVFDLSVQLAEKNHAPKLAAPVADQIYKPNQAFSFQVPRSSFLDVDGDALSFQARLDNGNPLPEWIKFNAATLTFSGVVPSGQRAPTEIRLIASDPKALQEYDVFSIGIDEKTAPPVVQKPLADQSVVEDQAFAFTVPDDAFADLEPSGPLAFTATLADGSALPSWLRFDAATRTFSGTAENAHVGRLQVRVTASEPDAGSVFDIFELNVVNTNDAPTVQDLAARTNRNAPLSLAAATLLQLARDIDPTRDLLSVTAVGAASHGTVALREDGSVLFTPDAGYVGAASFSFTVSDGQGGSATATVSVDVVQVAQAPVALDATLGMFEDGSLVLGAASFGYSDEDGGELVSVSVTAPDAGRLLFGGEAVSGRITVSRADLDAGKLVFVPGMDANGAAYARLSFQVDNGLVSNAATLTVDVAAVNDAPVLVADSVATDAGERAPLTGNVLANDRDVDAGTVLAVLAPGSYAGRYGSLTLQADGSYEYLLDAAAARALAEGEVAADTFSYVASDGSVSRASELVVRITGRNDAPLASVDVAAVAEDGVVVAEGNVLANDADPDDSALLRVAMPGNFAGLYGRLELAADGSYRYVLDNGSAAVQGLAAGQQVAERFDYEASDGMTTSSASLTITIVGANDTPVAVGDVAGVSEDDRLSASGNVLGNDIDPDGGTVLAVKDAGQRIGSYGTLVLLENGAYTYTLDNASSAVQSLREGQVVEEVFGYTAFDGGSEQASELVVRITGSNDRPLLSVDVAAVAEDGVAVAEGNVLANDLDADGGTALRVAAPGSYAGLYGSLALALDGSYRYVLDHASAAVQALAAGQRVVERFDYEATDGTATSGASLQIAIAGANDVPVATGDVAGVGEDGLLAANGNVLGNDSDLDAGTVLTVGDAGQRRGSYGTLLLLENGGYTYTLDNTSGAVQSLRSGQVVEEVFAYTATDGSAAAGGKLTVRVSGSNDGPDARDDAANIGEDNGAKITGNLLANDLDVDAGTVLRVTTAGTLTGSYGSLSLGADGSYGYVLNTAAVQSLAAGQVAYEQFSYAIADDDVTGPLSDSALLRIAIAGANDGPTLAKALEDKRSAPGTQFSYQIDAGSFTDIDAGDLLTYSATLADGKALPDWLRFDAATRTFSGTAAATEADLLLGLRVTATDRSGATASDDFTLTIAGEQRGRFIEGTCWSDYLVGTAYNDTIDGKESRDVMVGGSGDDTYYVDSDCWYGYCGGWYDSDCNVGYQYEDCGDYRPRATSSWYWGWDYQCGTDDVLEKAGQGFDTVYSSANYTLAANVEVLRLLGYANLDGNGNALDNAVYGNAGCNALDGGAGTDLLFGGAGSDCLTDTQGNNLLDGGAGNDTLNGGAGREFLVGGAGDDIIGTGKGADVIAFNRGDGRDIVLASTGKDNTLSLGNGITYADLRFARNGADLILITGTNEQVTLKDWYAASWLWGTDNRSIASLQVVTEGTSDYNAGSTNKLNNRKVQQFDFGSLVAKFDAARAANPRLTTWSLASALPAAHLGGSDSAAIGGELAYRYARTDNVEGIAIGTGQAVLAAADFGVGKQSVGTQAPLSAWGVTSSVLSFHVAANGGALMGGEAMTQEGMAPVVTASMIAADAMAERSDPTWKGVRRPMRFDI